FSMGNNDSDNDFGRDYQTVWYGTGSNWSNPADLGDLQLAGGDYFYGFEEIFFNTSVNLYPNPTSGNVYLQTTTNDLNGDVTIYVSDITGKTMKVINQRLNGINNIVTIGTDDLPTGMYIVNIFTESGKRAVKKLIVY
nr:T9SS type A sorting domain-containing protein [Lentimicrobiaceae bacterium]